MAFSADTLKKAFARSGGRCECSRASHAKHTGRCSATFTEAQRGTKWEAHHKVSLDAGGTDALENCKILCVPCHNLVPK